MNYLALMIGLIAMQQASAQTCEPASKEMAQYFLQSSWRAHSVEGPAGVAGIPGYIDQANNFYLSDLSRGGFAAASVTVDPANKGYHEFFKYCRAGKTSYLRSMRRSAEGNKYRVSMRYLPELSGFNNNPLAASNYKENSVSLRLKFEANSAIDTLESYPDRTKRDVFNVLNKQMTDQKMGVVELDLTGWDDVVCDMLQGRFNIWINRSGISNAPIVTQNKEVDSLDVQTTYRALREQIGVSLGKEKAIFMASRAMAKLESDRRIGPWVEKNGFEVLKKFMTNEMTRIADLDGAGLACVADQMQSYGRGTVSHFINVQFKAPSLDEVEASAERRK